MRYVIATVCLLAVPVFAGATTIKCKVDGDVLGPQFVSWDSESGAANIYLEDGNHHGVVTRSQIRETGHAVNLMFEGVGSLAETEFTVFPTATGHAIYGVSYERVDGKRYLAAFHGHFHATCPDLPRNALLFEG